MAEIKRKCRMWKLCSFLYEAMDTKWISGLLSSGAVLRSELELRSEVKVQLNLEEVKNPKIGRVGGKGALTGC